MIIVGMTSSVYQLWSHLNCVIQGVHALSLARCSDVLQWTTFSYWRKHAVFLNWWLNMPPITFYPACEQGAYIYSSAKTCTTRSPEDRVLSQTFVLYEMEWTEVNHLSLPMSVQVRPVDLPHEDKKTRSSIPKKYCPLHQGEFWSVLPHVFIGPWRGKSQMAFSDLPLQI